MVNKLHHELLISYCKDRLNKLPHGYCGTHRGHAVIYVTYDPMDKSVDPRNKRIIRLCTKQGEIYRELIEEADRVELTLRSLQKNGIPHIKIIHASLSIRLLRKYSR